MLRFRLLAAAGILFPLFVFLWADYALGPMGVWLFPVGLLIVMLAAAEVLELFSAGDLRPSPWSVYGGVALVFTAAAAPLAWSLRGLAYPPDCPLGRLGWPLVGMAAAVALAFGIEIRRYRRPGRSTLRVALSVFVVAYTGLLASFWVLLRLLQDNALGMTALVSMVLVAKLSDTGAYTFGRLFGRRRFAPRLSPGKTWEGVFGGVLTGGAASLAYFTWVAPQILGADPPGNPWLWAAYGVVLSVVAVLGDLSESLMKRDMRRKDSSTWMLGLGGVLDVVDSPLMCGPVAYLFWSAML